MQSAVGYDRVLQAISVSQSPGASQEQRAAALQLIDQAKRAEVHNVTEISLALLAPGNPIEVQHAGFQLLIFLAANRWEEFSAEEHARLLNVSLQQLQRVAAPNEAAPPVPWPLKSKSALLLATVLKRQGPQALQGVLGQLLGFAQSGVVHTELACVVLRHVAEEVTQYYDDLDGELKRQLLSALTSCLPSVLPFLVSALERGFGAALQASQAGDSAAARAHGSLVEAALGTCAVYAEWSPLPRLVDSGMLQAAAFLVNTLEFRTPACEVLRQVALRKQGSEESSTYQSVMQTLAESLVRSAASLLATPGEVEELGYEGRHDEFGLRLCDTMAQFGGQHFRCVAGQEARIAYLQQMLAFAQHSYLLLSGAALPFWIDLLRAMAERASRVNASSSSAAAAAAAAGSAAGSAAAGMGTAPGAAAAAGSDDSSAQGGHDAVPPDCVAALMELAGSQMVKGVHLVEDEVDDMPPFFDSFQDYKEFCVGYRLKLSQLVRFTSQLLPGQALDAATKRLDAVLPMCLPGSGVALLAQKTQLEAATVFCEAVVSAVADQHLTAGGQPRTPHADAVLSGMEVIMQRLVSAPISEPYLLYFQSKALEPFGRLLAARKHLAPALIQKTFDMLAAVPLNGEVVPPARTTKEWKDAFHARHRVAGILLANAKVAPSAFVPHLEALATRTQQAWAGQQLRAGERNVLGEAMLAAAQGEGGALMTQVLEWVLSSVRSDWLSRPFLSSLANPHAFIGTYLQVVPTDAQGNVEVQGREARWTLYHELHLIFRVAQRLSSPAGSESYAKGGHGGSASVAAAAAAAAASGQSSVFAPHLAWTLPPMLQVCACMHALWTPAIRSGQLAPIDAALEMPPAERALYLKQGSALKQVTDEEGGDTLASTTVSSVRSWFRNVREVAYQALGLLPQTTPELYSHQAMRAAWPIALMSDLEGLNHQHMRMLLRHVLLPMLRTAPPSAREGWLLPLLQRLLPHMHARLSESWGRVQSTSSTGFDTNRPSSGGFSSPRASSASWGASSVVAEGADADEVVASRLTAELTREHMAAIALLQGHDRASLLAAQQSAGQQAQQQQQGQPPGLPQAPLAEAGGGESLLEWLLKRDTDCGFSAVATATSALCWPDVSVGPAASFCRFVVTLAPLDARLAAFVGGPMLANAIGGLAQPSSSPQVAEVLQLLRDILAQQLGKSDGPRQVLLSVPGMNDGRIAELAVALGRTGSEKEQRNLIKKALAASGGPMFSNLSEWRTRQAAGGSIQLAAPVAKPPSTSSAGDDGHDFGVSFMLSQLLDGNVAL